MGDGEVAMGQGTEKGVMTGGKNGDGLRFLGFT